MKIKTKIQLYSTVWLLIILLLINIAVYFLFMKMTTDSEIERLQSQTETIVEALHGDINQEFSSSNLLRAYMPTNGMIRVINENEQDVSVVTSDTRLTEVPVQFRNNQGHTTYTLEDGERLAISYYPIIWADGSVVTLEVTDSLATIQQNTNALFIVLTIASLFVLIPSIFGGRLLSNLILRPINSMVGTMREIQERGTFKQIELKNQSQDELYQMANTFNQMMSRLKQNFDKQEQFVSDASHELKTPLTVIESYTNLLKRWGMERPDVFQEALDAISSESERMRTLTEHMLSLAKDESEGELDVTKVDLVSLCQKTRHPFMQLHERKINILHDENHVYALADEQKVKQALYILLDNAMKYSKQEITIRIGYDSEYAVVSVQDKGVGIPAKDLPHIFDRFYRVDEARARQTGGSGLGLPIAQQIIHAHHGELTVDSHEQTGSTFYVKLPAAH